MSAQTIPFKKAGQFGLSNSLDHIESVRQFRDAAIADGWEIKPTYGAHEGQDSAASLTRDGYKMIILTRDKTSENRKWKYVASIDIWGPDGISIATPELYDFDAIKHGVTTCPVCGATGVKTVRVAFANRACEACAPELRKKLERPGWNN
jgi:hypothetical protein